ncbi:MAG: hypothetical protein WCT18_03480 [Patescibacteria group bacterium]
MRKNIVFKNGMSHDYNENKILTTEQLQTPANLPLLEFLKPNEQISFVLKKTPNKIECNCGYPGWAEADCPDKILLSHSIFWQATVFDQEKRPLRLFICPECQKVHLHKALFLANPKRLIWPGDPLYLIINCPQFPEFTEQEGTLFNLRQAKPNKFLCANCGYGKNETELLFWSALVSDKKYSFYDVCLCPHCHNIVGISYIV